MSISNSYKIALSDCVDGAHLRRGRCEAIAISSVLFRGRGSFSRWIRLALFWYSSFSRRLLSCKCRLWRGLCPGRLIIFLLQITLLLRLSLPFLSFSTILRLPSYGFTSIFITIKYCPHLCSTFPFPSTYL